MPERIDPAHRAELQADIFDDLDRVMRNRRSTTISRKAGIPIKDNRPGIGMLGAEGYYCVAMFLAAEKVTDDQTSLWLIKDDVPMSRPISARGDFGVPPGAPAVLYDALRVDLFRSDPDAARMSGYRDGEWEVFEDLDPYVTVFSDQPAIESFARAFLWSCGKAEGAPGPVQNALGHIVLQSPHC